MEVCKSVDHIFIYDTYIRLRLLIRSHMSCSAWRPISLQKAAGLAVTSDSSVRSGFLRNWPFFRRPRQSHGRPEPHATWISHQLLQLPARFSHFGCRLRWRSWFSHIRAAARGCIREQIRSGPTQTHKDHRQDDPKPPTQTELWQYTNWLIECSADD